MGTYYTGILYCIGRYTKPGYLYHTGTGKSWIGASLCDLTMLSVLNINKKSKIKEKEKRKCKQWHKNSQVQTLEVWIVIRCLFYWTKDKITSMHICSRSITRTNYMNQDKRLF